MAGIVLPFEQPGGSEQRRLLEAPLPGPARRDWDEKSLWSRKRSGAGMRTGTTWFGLSTTL